MRKKINWGILGLGKIAHKFAADLQHSDRAVLYGVASRDINKAKHFKKTFNAIKHFGSYQALIDDANIDIIYIATPHSFHFEHTMMSLNNGKAVLCEKPMGLNLNQVRAMVQEAKRRNLFLMEAIWTRFIPTIEKLTDILNHTTIGDILSIHADFGFKAAVDVEGRIYNKQLGGGSLLDIGIYPIYLSLLFMGIPKTIKATARITQTGVDSSCHMLFDYENGEKAVLTSSIEVHTPTEAYIYGSEGTIKLHRRFHHSEKMTLSQNGQEEIIDLKYQGNGYIHEIEEVHTCLLNQQTESSKIPLQTSIDLISIIDRVKAQIGLHYA